MGLITFKPNNNTDAESGQIRSNFWSVFSRIRAEYGEILRSWTLLTQ